MRHIVDAVTRVAKRNYYLVHVWRGRLEFPQLRHMLVALAREHQPNRILVEQAGVGLPLIQEFRANPVPGMPVPQGVKPKFEKLVRMEAQSARFENRQVHLPREATWLSDLLHEIFAFPKARYDDQVDSISQFLNWAEKDHCSQPWIGCTPKIFVDGREWHPPADSA
jgi:predicted phage terminase large subunit-like protein